MKGLFVIIALFPLFIWCQPSSCDSISEYLTINPNDDSGYEALGICLMLTDESRLHEALEAFGKAIYYVTEENKNRIGFRYFEMASCYVLLGNMNEACQYVDKSLLYGFTEAEGFRNSHCLKGVSR